MLGIGSSQSGFEHFELAWVLNQVSLRAGLAKVGVLDLEPPNEGISLSC